jgi:RNA polymerase sigma-70 factor (ECF subfamily)
MDPPDHVDDRQLARRIVAGDHAAFRALFDLYFPRLYRYTLARLGGERDDVRDVVQQTFCRAIEKLDTYRGEAALFTWFCQICNRLIVDRQRARGVESRRLVHIEDSPQVQAVLEALSGGALDGPEFELWRSDVGRLVRATLDRLPERHAQVLEWKYVEELSVEDIARRLSVAPKSPPYLRVRRMTRCRLVPIDSQRGALTTQRSGTAEVASVAISPLNGVVVTVSPAVANGASASVEVVLSNTAG